MKRIILMLLVLLAAPVLAHMSVTHNLEAIPDGTTCISCLVGFYGDCEFASAVECPEYPVDQDCHGPAHYPPAGVGCAVCFVLDPPPHEIPSGEVCFLNWDISGYGNVFADGFETGDTSQW